LSEDDEAKRERKEEAREDQVEGEAEDEHAEEPGGDDRLTTQRRLEVIENIAAKCFAASP
jgi:hypothetical protein